MKPIRHIAPPLWMTEAPTQALMHALEGFEVAPKAMFVGGCVRNTLLGKPEGDIDVATQFAPQDVIRRLQAARMKVVPTGMEHGTVTAVGIGKTFEVTSLRKDVETDGRRAVIAFTEDWLEDAQRRDFTMNTLLASASGAVYDPTGQGVKDLEAGKVVFVGDPAQRIAEDYLRILRFFRFHCYYGKGVPDAAALKACVAAADKIGTLSRERITHEFLRILLADNPTDIIELMLKNKILNGFPHTIYQKDVLFRLCDFQYRHRAVDLMPRLFVFAGLRRDALPGFEGRLVFSNVQKKTFEVLGDIVNRSDEMSRSHIKPLIYKYGNEAVLQGVLVYAAIPDRTPANFQELVDVCRSWKAPAFPVKGDDLIKAGVQPGPALGQALARVEQWWMEQDFKPSKAECLKKF